MASWIIHLRIADALLHHLNVETSHFLAGSLAPDCGLRIGTNQFDPPASVTHFTNSGKANCEYSRFWKEFGQDETDHARRSFYLGYFAHLMTDVLWVERVSNPVKQEYRELYTSDREEFYRRVKGDWYDLDFLFLRKCPDLFAYRMLAELSDYQNDFLPYYGSEHLRTQFCFITQFYANDAVDEGREFPYLTAEQADAFVESALQDILCELRRICPICAK